MLSGIFSRQARRNFLIEYNPYQVLVAGVSRTRRGPLVIECAAEFSRDSNAALREWLEANIEERMTWTTAICSMIPPNGVIQRESIRGDKATDPNYLANFVREQQLRRSGSSAPFMKTDPGAWSLRAVDAMTGARLPPDNASHPALICGLANEDIHRAQQRLLDMHLMPIRLEPGLLSLFGVLYDHMARRRDPRAAVVIVIRQDTTAAYILGKEGVHTPNPVPHGFRSILQQAARESDVKEDTGSFSLLDRPEDELRKRAPRWLRSIGADLKPLIDSYEMTTGQPVGAVHCAYLPSSLGWMSEPIAKMVEHEPLTIDCNEWLQTTEMQIEPGVQPFGPNWLGALNLVAGMPDSTSLSAAKTSTVYSSAQRPWHVDCRQTATLPSTSLVGKEFAAAAIAAAVALFAVTFTAWQLYLTRALRTDTVYWEQQMAENRKLFEELQNTVSGLKEGTSRVGHAHELMNMPYQVTDFLMNLGRTLPPRMRIDRIEANDARVVVTGSLFEPAEEAGATLGRYMDGLRRTPEIGRLFESISTTSLQREEETDAIAFEITLRFTLPSA